MQTAFLVQSIRIEHFNAFFELLHFRQFNKANGQAVRCLQMES